MRQAKVLPATSPPTGRGVLSPHHRPTVVPSGGCCSDREGFWLDQRPSGLWEEEASLRWRRPHRKKHSPSPGASLHPCWVQPMNVGLARAPLASARHALTLPHVPRLSHSPVPSRPRPFGLEAFWGLHLLPRRDFPTRDTRVRIVHRISGLTRRLPPRPPLSMGDTLPGVSFTCPSAPLVQLTRNVTIAPVPRVSPSPGLPPVPEPIRSSASCLWGCERGKREGGAHRLEPRPGDCWWC